MNLVQTRIAENREIRENEKALSLNEAAQFLDRCRQLRNFEEVLIFRAFRGLNWQAFDKIEAAKSLIFCAFCAFLYISCIWRISRLHFTYFAVPSP